MDLSAPIAVLIFPTSMQALLRCCPLTLIVPLGEWVLRKAGIETLLVCGIVTNGGVASTVRDAHVRDFDVRVLEDGCAAFAPETHRTAIDALRPVAPIMSIDEALQAVAKA